MRAPAVASRAEEIITDTGVPCPDLRVCTSSKLLARMGVVGRRSLLEQSRVANWRGQPTCSWLVRNQEGAPKVCEMQAQVDNATMYMHHSRCLVPSLAAEGVREPSSFSSAPLHVTPLLSPIEEVSRMVLSLLFPLHHHPKSLRCPQIYGGAIPNQRNTPSASPVAPP